MVERTIKSTAIEFAGAFYEMKRSDVFRSKESKTAAKRLFIDPKTNLPVEKTVIVKFFEAYPTAHSYSKAHWPLFYDLARKSLVTMLSYPDSRMSPHMKEAIFKAIMEDRNKQHVEEYKRGGHVDELHGQIQRMMDAESAKPRTLQNG